eukprot:TRINITY_DN44042_c0_g1_i1.p1 TRINITY_DN44042_c0_g1~~TRINITY_DN44042_c0_g1_i1.p1  ORF type:complete len:206 (+),score=22.13 TRINITY_DN44042_c0_g1_i1:65-682(+)
MIRRPPRSTQGVSSAASDVYKRQGQTLTVTISGQGTHFNQSTTTIAPPNLAQVWLKQGESVSIVPNYQIVVSDTEITAEFTFSEYHPEGLYDVNIYSDIDGFLELPGVFVLNPTSFSVNKPDDQSSHRLYPNPCFGNFNLETKNSEPLVFELWSASGQLICTDKIEAGDNSKSFNFRELPKGIYIYFLHSEKNIEKGKIIFQQEN